MRKMPKECLISKGCYERVPAFKNGERELYRGFIIMKELTRLGYDQVPAFSTWACHQNAAQTVLFCRDEGLIDEHLLGFLAVPWQRTDEVSRYLLLDDAYRTKYAKELFESCL